jgi:hypothetical protein
MRVFPKKTGIDPKLVSDQLGYRLGVNLDVYTIAGLDQRLEAVNIGRSCQIDVCCC